MEINGIAHIQLTVSDFEACLPFYERLLVFLGLKPVMKATTQSKCAMLTVRP